MTERTLFLSLGRNGGCVRYATEVADAWVAGPVDVVTSCYSTERQPRSTYARVRTYRRRWEFALRTLLVYPVLLAWLFVQLLRNRYAALYIPYFHHWEWGAILLFACFRKKVVYTVHDGVQHSGEEERVGAMIARASIERATEIVCLSRYVAEVVRERYRPRAGLHVIPHGVFRLPGVTSVRKHSTRPNVLFLGRVFPYKGVELLVEAVTGMERSEYGELVIAGKWGYPVSVQARDGLRIDDRWLSEHEIVAYLNASHILVLPYVEATQSGVVTHGIDAALPMVCTDVGGLAEQVGDRGAVFVAPNAGAIREGIRRLTRNSAEYDAIHRCLLEKRSALSWTEIARDIAQVLGPHTSRAQV